MPTYKFYDTKTQEEFVQFMGISERDRFLEANPHIEPRVHGAPMIGDPGRLMGNGKKLPETYRQMLKTMKKRNPGSTINDR